MALARIWTPAAEFAFHIEYHYTTDPWSSSIFRKFIFFLPRGVNQVRSWLNKVDRHSDRLRIFPDFKMLLRLSSKRSFGWPTSQYLYVLASDNDNTHYIISFISFLDQNCQDSLGLDWNLPPEKWVPDEQITASTEQVYRHASYGRFRAQW